MVTVAIPLMRCMKFNTTLSAIRMLLALPANSKPQITIPYWKSELSGDQIRSDQSSQQTPARWHWQTQYFREKITIPCTYQKQYQSATPLLPCHHPSLPTPPKYNHEQEKPLKWAQFKTKHTVVTVTNPGQTIRTWNAFITMTQKTSQCKDKLQNAFNRIHRF